MNMIDISAIRTDGGTQARLKLNKDVVKEYSEHMKDGDKFPPIIVFHDGSEYWLADGLAVGVLVALAYLYSGLQGMRPDINGEWRADVTYDWLNASYVEKFYFHGKGEEVYGTASFLGTKRGILEGSIRKNVLQFITRTKEFRGADSKNPRDSVHHYRGEFAGKEIKFIMQTDGGYSEPVPIDFVAEKVANP